MNIAFLFNADHDSLGSFYGAQIYDYILTSGILQKTKRGMRVSIGDILTFSTSAGETFEYFNSLCQRIYSPKYYDRLQYNALTKTYLESTVFCWLFQNMTVEIAQELHLYLGKKASPYLGAMDVDFSDSTQLKFFRNSLI